MKKMILAALCLMAFLSGCNGDSKKRRFEESRRIVPAGRVVIRFGQLQLG